MKELEQISSNMIERYSKRYKELGYDVKTLGWGSTVQQFFRFKQTLCSEINFNSKSILDLGCGFGDYLILLEKENINYVKYYGWDVNQDLIDEAKNRWKDNAKAEFNVFDIVNPAPTGRVADIGVMLGLLNLDLKNSMDNYEYSKKIINNAYDMVNEVLIVDFLSSNQFEDYPEEDFIFYHNPSKMLDYAFTLSNNVLLKHNYQPIPQKEFMLFIYK